MAMPTVPVTDLILVETRFAFAFLDGGFDAPASPGHFGQGAQRRAAWGVGQVVGQLRRVGDGAPRQQPALRARHSPTFLEDAHSRPVVKAWPLFSLTHRQSLPCLGRQGSDHHRDWFPRRRSIRQARLLPGPPPLTREGGSGPPRAEAHATPACSPRPPARTSCPPELPGREPACRLRRSHHRSPTPSARLAPRHAPTSGSPTATWSERPPLPVHVPRGGAPESWHHSSGRYSRRSRKV